MQFDADPFQLVVSCKQYLFMCFIIYMFQTSDHPKLIIECDIEIHDFMKPEKSRNGNDNKQDFFHGIFWFLYLTSDHSTTEHTPQPKQSNDW